LWQRASWAYNTSTLPPHSLIRKKRLTPQALCGMMELQLKKEMENEFNELQMLSLNIKHTAGFIQNDMRKLLDAGILTRSELWDCYYEFKQRMSYHKIRLEQIEKKVSEEFLKFYDESSTVRVKGKCYARLTGINVYDFANNEVNSILEKGKVYTVVGGRMGGSKTYIVLEGHENTSFNSVMFDIEGELPFKYEDSYVTREQLMKWAKEYTDEKYDENIHTQPNNTTEA
jgi:hypothetical protein